MESLTLSIKNPDSLREIRNYVKTAALSVNLKSRTINRVVRAVGEIIETLFAYSPSEVLHLQAKFYGQVLSIIIEYDGFPYNPYNSFDWLNLSMVTHEGSNFIHQWRDNQNQIIYSALETNF